MADIVQTLKRHEGAINAFGKRKKLLSLAVAVVSFLGIGTIIGGIVYVARQPTPEQIEKIRDRVDQTRDIIRDVQVQQGRLVDSLDTMKTTITEIKNALVKTP